MRELFTMIALSLLLTMAAFADSNLTSVPRAAPGNLVLPHSGKSTFALTSTSVATDTATNVETRQKSKITGPSVPPTPPKMPEEPTKPTGFR